jgi:ubiquinone/menaquinone biosynthesis C-methylase UbiE
VSQGVHRTASHFGDVAAQYERARPGYPPDAIDAIARSLRLGPGITVADVGAGTGKLTRLLLGSGATVVAVEPMAGMREQLRTTVPGVEVRSGTAEAMPFADAELDAVTVAQAAHWFAPSAAAELARTLRLGGGIAVVYNVRDTRQAVHRVITAQRARVAAGAPHRSSGEWRRPFDTCSALDGAAISVHEWSTPFTHAAILEQVDSLAPVAALDAESRARVHEAVVEVLRHEPDPVELRYRTEVYVWRRR